MISTMRCFPVISLLASFRLLSLVGCKPMHDVVRSQSLAARDNLLKALETDRSALRGQHESEPSGSYTTADDVIFKLEKRHLQLHTASANGLTRLGLVNGGDREGERRAALTVEEQLGGQLVRAGVPAERPAETGSRVQAVPHDPYNDVHGVDPYSKVAKRVAKSLENYIQTYAESFEDLQKRVVGEIFTNDVLERIENCSSNEELKLQLLSESVKIITSANLTEIILNNKNLTPDEFQNEVESLSYQIVSDRISQAMLELKKAVSFQINVTLENYCGVDRLRHGGDVLDLSVNYDPKFRLLQSAVGCREFPCGTIPTEPPATESATVTPPPMAACVCPCGTKPPTDSPTETTVRPTTPEQGTSLGHCRCPCGTLPPPPLVPEVIQAFATASPALCPNCAGGFESSTSPCPNCSTVDPNGSPPNFGEQRMVKGTLFEDSPEEEYDETQNEYGESTTETATTSGRIPNNIVPADLRELTPLEITGNEHTSAINISNENEFPARPQFSANDERTTATSILNRWPSLIPSKPILFKTDTGRGQLMFKMLFKDRQKPRDESSSEESSRRKHKHKHKSSCSSCSSSSSEEGDSKRKCSGKVKQFHRKSPRSTDRSGGKSYSSASDCSQCLFSSSESSEECYSCSQECSDESCSSSDGSSCASCSDTEEDRSR